MKKDEAVLAIVPFFGDETWGSDFPSTRGDNVMIACAFITFPNKRPNRNEIICSIHFRDGLDGFFKAFTVYTQYDLFTNLVKERL